MLPPLYKVGLHDHFIQVYTNNQETHNTTDWKTHDTYLELSQLSIFEKLWTYLPGVEIMNMTIYCSKINNAGTYRKSLLIQTTICFFIIRKPFKDGNSKEQSIANK